MKEQMAQSSSVTSLIRVLLILYTSVIPMANTCELAVRGGGCPDMKQCIETCRPCYRGVGEVHVYCRPSGGGIPFDECICSMEKGASCNPVGPPRCPRPWPPTATIATEHNETL